MPKSFLPRAAAVVGAAALLTFSVAAPVHAEPWDGDHIDFGLGEWYPSYDSFTMDDVYLHNPDVADPVYTDIWDGMGYQSIVSDALGLDYETVYCDEPEDLDIVTDAASGDLLITCVAANGAFADAGLTVVSQYRIFSTSDLIRVTTWISNETAAAVAIDGVEFTTDFGSSGALWGYQGQNDAVLPVPALEDEDSRDALNAAGAQWAVHYEEYDAPGGLAWGSAGAEATATLTELDDDIYVAEVGAFTIPAGETRAVAYFALWNPATLIELDYFNEEGNGQEAAADALVPAMAEFNSFSGRLTAGLEGNVVVNWTAADAPVEPAKPQLAATGVDASTPIVLGFGLLILGGIAVTVIARRRAAHQ